MKISIVMGTTGEYSDRSEWPVRAFLTARRAETYALAAKQRANEIAHEHGGPRLVSQEILGPKPNELDPGMKMDYTGTDYFIIADIELDEEPEP